MRLNKLRSLNSGDTIVEVMIVLAILGLAISIAYATANRSLLNARQAQETSTATELVQSQVENLRAMAGNDSSDPTHYIYQSAGTLFCVDNIPQVVPSFGGGPALIYNYAIYPAACVRNTLYHLSINRNDPTTDTFTVKAIWDDVLGDGQDSVTLIYRAHSP